MKMAILDERKQLTTEDIVDRLQERHAMRTAFLDIGKLIMYAVSLQSPAH